MFSMVKKQKYNKRLKKIQKYWNNKAFEVHEFYQKYKDHKEWNVKDWNIYKDEFWELIYQSNIFNQYYKVKTNLGDTISFYYHTNRGWTYKINSDITYTI